MRVRNCHRAAIIRIYPYKEEGYFILLGNTDTGTRKCRIDNKLIIRGLNTGSTKAEPD